MFAKSVSVFHAQVIKLSKEALSLDKKAVRDVFHPLFFNKKWLTDLTISFDSSNEMIRYNENSKFIPPHGNPFIKELGQVSFRAPGDLIYSLGEKNNELESFSLDLDRSFSLQSKYFGFDPEISDQRMNHLFLELDKPIFIKAIYKKKVQAQGKIFVHIYPSGYVTLLTAVSLMPHNLISEQNIGKAIFETHPWGKNHTWVWGSRIGIGRLEVITSKVRECILNSLFFKIHTYDNAYGQTWKTAVRLTSDNSIDYLAKVLLEEGFERKFIKKMDSSIFDNDQSTNIKELLLSKRVFIARLSNDHSPKSAHYFFWNVLKLAEFLHLKNMIYEDYIAFLKKEIVKLKKYRLSFYDKFIEEEISKIKVFDPNIPEYLYALDKQIHSARPTYRYIYSILSAQTGFPLKRNRLKEIMQEWEVEVDRWDNIFIALWKKVFSPILKIIK